MPSLNLDLNYFDHIKTMRLVARLGPGADVLPIRLWAYTGRHNPASGTLGLLEGELEHAIGWWGEKGAALRALIEIGFVTREGDLYAIHDWLEHSGHLAIFKKRALKANKIRWGRERKLRTPTRTPKHEVKESPSSAVPCRAVQSIKVKDKRSHLPPKKSFVKPTPAEITAYAKEIGFVLDGQHFWDHYEANGWRVGRNPMRDWRAAVRTWRRSEFRTEGKNNGSNGSESFSEQLARRRAEIEAKKNREREPGAEQVPARL